MRVAHVLHELDPALGGPTTVLLNMALASARLGVDVEIWTAQAHDTTLPDVGTSPGSLTRVERPGPVHSERAFVGRFAADLGRVDLLHTHLFWRPHVAGFARLSRRTGTPLLHTMHGMFTTWCMRQKRWRKRLHLRLRGQRQLDDTAVVQMLNHSETEQSRQVGVRFRYFELANGVDTTAFEALPPRGRFRETDPALSDKCIILSMGRLHHVKGPELLLGAFLDIAPDHPDIALVMAGPAAGMLPQLRRMMADHPAAGRVRLPGLVRGERRLALLRDADIFAQCSYHETASMSIIEGAYAGKLMLVTDRCNCPDIADGEADLVVPADREAVRRGLRRLVTEKAQRGPRGAAARRLVEQRFTLDAVTPVWSSTTGESSRVTGIPPYETEASAHTGRRRRRPTAATMRGRPAGVGASCGDVWVGAGHGASVYATLSARPICGRQPQ